MNTPRAALGTGAHPRCERTVLSQRHDRMGGCGLVETTSSTKQSLREPSQERHRTTAHDRSLRVSIAMVGVRVIEQKYHISRSCQAGVIDFDKISLAQPHVPMCFRSCLSITRHLNRRDSSVVQYPAFDRDTVRVKGEALSLLKTLLNSASYPVDCRRRQGSLFDRRPQEASEAAPSWNGYAARFLVLDKSSSTKVATMVVLPSLNG